MIQPAPHTDPGDSIIALQRWIEQHVRTPEDEPVSANIARVLVIGALIGARFTLIASSFGLGLALFCSETPGTIYDSINRGFYADYGRSLLEQVAALYHNAGFAGRSANLQKPSEPCLRRPLPPSEKTQGQIRAGTAPDSDMVPFAPLQSPGEYPPRTGCDPTMTPSRQIGVFSEVRP